MGALLAVPLRNAAFAAEPLQHPDLPAGLAAITTDGMHTPYYGR